MYPVWASLARDYLAIMASSVSSERAFSSSGMTITKRRNRLTHDIVEALQILKAAIREDLLFRPEEPSKALELAILVEQSESQAQSSESQASEKWSNGIPLLSRSTSTTMTIFPWGQSLPTAFTPSSSVQTIYFIDLIGPFEDCITRNFTSSLLLLGNVFVH